MSRSIAPVLVLLACLAGPGAAQAQLDAPVWYVQYEVRVHADATQQGTGLRGHTTNVWKIENVFTDTVKLDMRNEGAVLSMDLSKIDMSNYAKLTPQEQLKITQQMMDAMQYTANWMPGPLENLDGQDAMLMHMKDVSVPVRISYESTITGSDLVNETGSHYDYFEQTSAACAGVNVYTSPDQTKFEMNTATHKYWLSLPYAFQSLDGKGDEVQWVTVTKYRAAGTSAWDPEERKTSTAGVDAMGSWFKMDPLPNGSTQPLIEGTLDASGKISGEKSFIGRTDRSGADVPVTLTYRYTVSQTPPPKPAAKK